MRGIQWWNSGSWDVGDPDRRVWTDVRTVRRLRAVRGLKVAAAIVLAAALGTVVVLACAGERSGQPAALLQAHG